MLNGKIIIGPGPQVIRGSLGIFGNLKIGGRAGQTSGPIQTYIEVGGDVFGGGEFYPILKGDWGFYIYAGVVVDINLPWYTVNERFQYRLGGSIPL